ncbi:MAG: M23 family metallopeptidase [Candidatus Gastranaerophilales bacterium]|nr:M23 family metallopeptidase [Candidatus Gastranaerophilales bacterium]
MRAFFVVFVVIVSVFVFSNTVYSRNNGNIVSVHPFENVKQGQTVFVEVVSKNKFKNPQIVFGNKIIKMFNQGNGLYRGLIGIDAVKKPGRNKILITDNTGKLYEEKFINVVPVRYPIQNIVISGKKGGLGATKDELAKVQKAKYTLSNYAYWSKPPFNSPTNGCIISVYGLNRYHNGISTGDFHKGLDIKAPQGQRISAVSSGKVLIARKFRLHGGTVAIDHGQGVVSFYLHMSKITAKEGELIKTGQKIGEVGATGFATGPHLHWGLYINGVPVNPMEFWIKKANKC